MAFIVALWIFLFLFFAEPFKIDRFTLIKKLWTLPIYGLIQAGAYLAAIPYQNKIVFGLKNRWTLKNELVYFLIVTLVAWMANYCFYLFFVTSHENTYSFTDHAMYHFLPGLAFVLPIFIISRYALGFLYERNLLSQKEYIHIGDGKTDGFKVLKADLIYIRSDDNYLLVYFSKDGAVTKKMLRGKLVDILNRYPELKRVHRSFIVNPLCFESSISKSGKLFLVLKNGIQVPVSRNIKKEIKSYFDIP